MAKLHLAKPGQSIPESYFQARFVSLRKPLGLPLGSERLLDDDKAIHAWIEDPSGEVLSVGRIHLIPEGGGGACTEHQGTDAPLCPPFTALALGGDHLRPATQIRQMGTRPSSKRQGLAKKVLRALEGEAMTLWGAESGWLHARERAVPFYGDSGWTVLGQPFVIPTIGLHATMNKRLTPH
ncbi:GNAT family N-acetyltransferase [bacterium]|nr:GNAT family N-acetyltransferase [bacterium]